MGEDRSQMTEIALPLTGGCLCGACRYELRAAPIAVYACHCTDCRRQSGSAFGMSMPAPRAAFAVTSGEPATWPRILPSGRRSTVRFCATCATRLFAESTETIVTIRPGTLDDTRWLRPAAQMFMRSALPWACIAEVQGFEAQPSSFEDVARAWRVQGLRFVSRPEGT